MGATNQGSTAAALLAYVLTQQGRHEEAIRYADLATASAAPHDTASHVPQLAACAHVLAARGDLEPAEATAREAVRLSGRSDDICQRGDALVQFAAVLDGAGRASDAATALQDAMALYERQGTSSPPIGPTRPWRTSAARQAAVTPVPRSGPPSRAAELHHPGSLHRGRRRVDHNLRNSRAQPQPANAPQTRAERGLSGRPFTPNREETRFAAGSARGFVVLARGGDVERGQLGGAERIGRSWFRESTAERDRLAAPDEPGADSWTRRQARSRPDRPPIGSAQRFEDGREVAQGPWLVDDPVAGQLIGPAGDVLEDLDHVVDVALRVRPPRDGQAHQVERCRHL